MIILKISANEICRSKGRVKITVKDVMEAIEKTGFKNFEPEIENLLIGNLNYELFIFLIIKLITTIAQTF